MHFQTLDFPAKMFHLTNQMVLLVDLPLDRRLIGGGNVAKREKKNRAEENEDFSLPLSCGPRYGGARVGLGGGHAACV